MTAYIELQGRINPVEIDMHPTEVIQKMDDAAHNGRFMVLLRKSGGNVIALNLMNVLSVDEVDAGELGD